LSACKKDQVFVKNLVTLKVKCYISKGIRVAVNEQGLQAAGPVTTLPKLILEEV
jgi:hypothetical protein